MKKMLLLALATLSIQGAFAQRAPGPGDRMDLVMCLKTLGNAEATINTLRYELNRCQMGSNDRNREVEERLRRENVQLRNDVSRLTYENSNLINSNIRLQNDNIELRRQLDEIRGPRTWGYFTYTSCKNYASTPDLRYVSSGEGQFALESETKASTNLSKEFTCNYGGIVVKTEEIKSSEANIYCVAGCTNYTGAVDDATLSGARGRNQAEAEFNAIKGVSKAHSCNYSIKVKSCQ